MVPLSACRRAMKGPFPLGRASGKVKSRRSGRYVLGLGKIAGDAIAHPCRYMAHKGRMWQAF